MKILKPLTFNPFTFSRATDATYLAASGFVETAGIDELRFGYEYDPSTDTLSSVGAIIEAEAQNRIRRSSEFEDVLWTQTGSPTISDNDTTSPDGTANAARFNGSVNTQSISQNLGSGWFPTSVIFSIWIKSTTTGGEIELSTGSTFSTFRIGSLNWGVDDAWASITPYPDDWFRCEMTAVVTGSAVARIKWQDVDFFMWGAQYEYDSTGTVSPARPASSYIPTEGTTVTRSADIVVSQTPSLISSNIAEDDAPVWNSGAYLPGNRVIVLGEYHRVYEAISSHTNKFPPDFLNVDWIDVGATNRWRMYDMNVGADLQSFATASGGDIDHLMGVETPVTSVVMLNVEGDLARVTMRNTLDNSIIYEREIDLLGTPMEVGWWEFFFDHREAISKIVLTDLPSIAPATIRVEIDGALSKIGKLIIGEAINIGCTRPGATVGIQSFSRKERDEFGNFFILQRRYIGKADFTVQLTSDMVDSVYNILAELIDIPAVYIGSEQYLCTVIYGFPRDFSIVIPGPHYSQCSLSVEGI